MNRYFFIFIQMKLIIIISVIFLTPIESTSLLSNYSTKENMNTSVVLKLHNQVDNANSSFFGPRKSELIVKNVIKTSRL